MADNENETPADPIPAPVSEDPIRLVPLSDIDAFVEIRAGSILDEAALLAIQFLGMGDRNKARSQFVQMAMDHFQSVGDAYDELRLVAAMKRRVAFMRERKAREAEATPEPPKEGEPT